MHGKPVPASMADVVGPMAEAADYERLQLLRRRGVVCLLLGLWASAATLFVVGSDAFLLAAIILFALTAIARRLLKRKLDWRSLFGTYEGGQPRFWHVLAFAVLFFLLAWVSPDWFVASFAHFEVTIAIAIAAIAFVSGARAKDWPLYHLGWLPLAVAAPILFGLAPHWLFVNREAAVIAALALPLLGLSLFRLLAPRRWLVR
jgi:hypothetical protein